MKNGCHRGDGRKGVLVVVYGGVIDGIRKIAETGDQGSFS